MYSMFAMIRIVIVTRWKGTSMKAYYLGQIETPSGILKRNREHDQVVGRALQLIIGDNELKFALFENRCASLIVVESYKHTNYLNVPLVYAELHDKGECDSFVLADLNAIRGQVFENDSRVSVEIPVDTDQPSVVAFLREIDR